MRRIFIALVALVAIFCSTTASAQVASNQCAIDKVISGTPAFAQCPFGDEDNFLINEGFDGLRLDEDVTLSQTPVWVGGVCKYVDARHIPAPLFVPLGLDAAHSDWKSFVANVPTGAHVAECCVPRPLRVDDVPVPTETCSSGWQFIGLANPDDTSKLLALPNGNGTFTFTNGASENQSYPIAKLPIERDDVGALVPNQGLSAYVGKFHCAGTVDFTTSTSPITLSTSSSSSTWSTISATGGDGVIVIQSGSSSSSSSSSTTNTPTSATDVTKFMGFAMQCVNNDWRHTSPSCHGKTVGIQVEACPNGATGLITRNVTQECDGSIKTEVASNTCSDICAPKTVTTEDRPCPNGEIGTVKVEVTKVCFGRQPVSTGTTTTTDGACECATSEKEITRACEGCPASTDISTLSKACPAGQTGEILVHKKRICTTSSQNNQCNTQNQCVCHEEETEENKCTTSCPASTDLGTTTKACPAGQTGQILVHKKRVCTATNNCCMCHDEVVEEKQCTTICNCTPSQHTETLACPAGQNGSIVRTTTHTCPDNKDVVTETNTCQTTTCESVKTQDDDFVIYTRRSVYCAGSGVTLSTRLSGTTANGVLVPASVFDNDFVPAGATISSFTQAVLTSDISTASDGHMPGFRSHDHNQGSAAGATLTYDGSGIFRLRPAAVCATRGTGGTIEGTFSYTLSNNCSHCSGNVHFKIVVQNSPLVLDLDGDGLSVYSLQNSPAVFDIDGNGIPEHTAWVGPREAFLVRDLNGDGVINNRDEMFGDTDSYSSGFANLAALDSNEDGVVDAKDPVFSTLRLWLDANGNGMTEPGELHTLAELGVASISVKPETISRVINGQLVSHEAQFTYTNGAAGKVYDIWFDAE